MQIIVNDTRTFKEKVKDKISELKVSIKNKLGEVGRWCLDHINVICVIVPTVIATATGIVKLVKMIRGSAAERHEARMENCYYDPSTGLHWDLKRNMTNSERSEFMSRKRAGEFTEDILKDMRILRK